MSHLRSSFPQFRNWKNTTHSNIFILISFEVIILQSYLITVSALMHEHSSPAQTMGSWVGNPLESWMSVCVYSVFVVLRVDSGLATG
jgi:hypothetical protein